MKQGKKVTPAAAMEEDEEETNCGMEEGDDERQPFNEIDQLQQHGINMADIAKLKQAGLTTCMSILMW